MLNSYYEHIILLIKQQISITKKRKDISIKSIAIGLIYRSERIKIERRSNYTITKGEGTKECTVFSF
jgi:hypothetical protein